MNIHKINSGKASTLKINTVFNSIYAPPCRTAWQTSIARQIGNCKQDKIDQTEALEPSDLLGPPMIERRTTNPRKLHHSIQTATLAQR